MDSKALAALISFCVQIAAGAAPVKWPQYTWLADLIFWGACILGIGCVLWWLISNYQFRWSITKKQKANSTPTSPSLSITSAGVIERVKTNPHDVPKKLNIIDDEVIPQIRDGGPLDEHVRRGRQILNSWKAAINTDRPAFLQQLQEYDQIQNGILNQIAKIQRSNSHFEDIASLLEIPNSPYNKVDNVETITKGFSEFKGAIGALGDPPYKLDLDYFFTPNLQNFSSGLANLGSWRKHTEEEFIKLRKQIASGQ